MISMAAAMLMTFSVMAQVTPMVLGEKHAMLRVEQPTKYLLLPVQETEDIAAIAVVNGKNEMTQRINVKLAVDRVDYYVPYELKDAQLLDIEFHGDRRLKGAVGEFACWKEIKYSDTFDTTNRERFRPVYHHTPVYGWMNDPNGMFYKDVGSIFSGSCVTNGDEVVAMYTTAGHHQTQSIAFSKDGGRTFQKYSGNPVLTADVPDFRDPRPFWNEDIKAWNLILAVGQEMRIYSSTDLTEWKYESAFGSEYGNHGGVWECPDLFKIDNKWVLICNINPGGPFGGSATQYFIGQFDGHKFTCESMPKVTKWMDYGKDHYATVSFYNAPENRHVVLAWMSNWQYANQVPTKQYRSGNSIPRDLGLFNYGEETYVSVVPSKEMLAMRGAKVRKPTEACEIVVDVKNQAEIVLSNTKGEQVTMVYDGHRQSFSMDRTKSGDVSFSEAFACRSIAPTYGHIKQLRLFIDRCSIEAFDAEGKMAMTNLVFPSEPYTNIKVKGGKATIYEIKN